MHYLVISPLLVTTSVANDRIEDQPTVAVFSRLQQSDIATRQQCWIAHPLVSLQPVQSAYAGLAPQTGQRGHGLPLARQSADRQHSAVLQDRLQSRCDTLRQR